MIVPILEDASPGIVLELACGTGQHAAHFAPLLPELVFQPTDLDDSAFDAVAHHVGGLPNVRPPLVLDASDRNWPALRASRKLRVRGVAVLIINLTHISPWVATLGAVRGAAEALRPGGKLISMALLRSTDDTRRRERDVRRESSRSKSRLGLQGCRGRRRNRRGLRAESWMWSRCPPTISP